MIMITIANIGEGKEVNVLRFINGAAGLAGVFCAGGAICAAAIILLAWHA
jgi:hypothetical protein